MTTKVKSSAPTPTWIVIDGYKYDISVFHKKHPGGNVINFYDGMDASDVFHAFHYRSESAKKWLATLPRQPVNQEDPNDGRLPVIAEFRKLREDLVKEGLFDPVPYPQIYRTFELFLWYATAIYLGRNGWWMLAGLLRGIWVARNGLLMHDSGHRAFACKTYADKMWNWFFFCFWQGGSPGFWNNQHNKHHAATQELGYDIDLNTLPVVAFNVKIALKGNANYLKYQWITFIPAQLFLFLFWKFTHTRFVIRSRNYFELLGLVLHEIFEFSILGTATGILGYIVITLMSWSIGGVYLATTFALNHTHKPAVEKNSYRNWVVRSAEHTTNLTPGLFTDWFTGYLNYQIEHHLFPQIPHPTLPLVQPRVQALFKKHNIEYDMKGIAEAFKLTMNNLYEVGNYTTLEKYQYLLKEQ